MGILILDGVRLSEALHAAERCGIRVFSARLDEEGNCVLDVSMDTAAANAFALALIGVNMRYLAAEEYAQLAS